MTGPPEIWTSPSRLALIVVSGCSTDGPQLAGTLVTVGRSLLRPSPSSSPKGSEIRSPEALDRLVELYTATSKPDEAKKWQAERAKYSEEKKKPEPKPPEKK